MIKYSAILLLVFAVFTFSSCEKVNEGSGSILVTAKSRGNGLSQAMIYLKKGTLSNPGLPLEQYDLTMSADAIGQVYFKNLAPDNYFILATGYSTDNKAYVKGEASVTVIRRNRQNYYEITVDTK